MYYLNFCPYSYNLHYEQIGKEVRCIEDEVPFEIPESWEWKTSEVLFIIMARRNRGRLLLYRYFRISDNQHQKLSAVETIIA